ncbi:dienelactone hydrolase family protein [Coralloluteibacterium thermophilus]|uniref:Dienelactone hydrolase family protein n=1 Tax=Coralloluteibacterium thermophilum TaxID=2707049 RepID=A0ABV9NK70_9GAMM
MGETVTLHTRNGEIGGYAARPARTPAGGIVLVQEIFGVNAHIRGVVDRFAEEGYATVAPAVFDHVERGIELGYDEAGFKRGRDLVGQLGIDRAVADVAAAAGWLRDQGVARVAAVGYCWGGSVAFLANTRLGLPSVSYYGGRTLPFVHEVPRAPMLFHFGEADPYITPADVQAHRDALPDAQVHTYPAGHGFNCEQRADYDAASAKLALERTLAFLRAALA